MIRSSCSPLPTKVFLYLNITLRQIMTSWETIMTVTCFIRFGLRTRLRKKIRDHVFSKVAQTAEQLPLTLNTLCYAQHFRSIKGAPRREGSCNFSKNSSNLRPHAVIDIFSRFEHAAGRNIVDDILILASPRYFVTIFNTLVTINTSLSFSMLYHIQYIHWTHFLAKNIWNTFL